MATRNPKPRRRVVSPLQRPDGSFPAGSRVMIDVRWKRDRWVISIRNGARLQAMLESGQLPAPSWALGMTRDPCRTKAEAVRGAVGVGRMYWQGGPHRDRDRIPAQVRIYGKDGALQSERTYPDVTPRRRG